MLTEGVRNKTRMLETLNTRLHVTKSCKSYNGYVLAFKYSNVSIPGLMLISEEPLLSGEAHFMHLSMLSPRVGGGGGVRAWGGDFDIFFKKKSKFPTPGAK